MKNQFININPYSRSGKKLTSVKKIIIHWTANPGATAHNHYKYFNNLKDRYASAHIFIDKTESLCIIPLDEVAYHANDGSYRGVAELKPNANYLSIGVELCVEKDGSIHPETLKKAAIDVAQLCRQFKLDPNEDIVRHYDVTHKNCPAPWVKNVKEFEMFKGYVKAMLGNEETKVVKTEEAPKTTVKAEVVTKPSKGGRTLVKKGDRGQIVKTIQTLVGARADGIFGPNTEAKLKAFQRTKGLVVDGLCGKNTWRALTGDTGGLLH